MLALPRRQLPCCLARSARRVQRREARADRADVAVARRRELEAEAAHLDGDAALWRGRMWAGVMRQ